MRYTSAILRSRALTLPAILFFIFSTLNITAEVDLPPRDPCSRDCVPAPPPSLPCVSDVLLPGLVSSLADFTVETESDAYATLFLDARNPDCAPRARERLEQRLGETLAAAGAAPGGMRRIWDYRRQAEVHPFQAWLAGSIVTQIFAAAKELDQRGITVDPSLLEAVKETYFGIPTSSAACAVPAPATAATCADDIAMTASGYAWISASEALKGRDANPPERPWATLARGAIADALLLVRDTRLGDDDALRSAGFGLEVMTSVASACGALSLAGTPCILSDGEKAVASALLRYAQENASQNGCYFDDFTATECPGRRRGRCPDEQSVLIAVPEPPAAVTPLRDYRPTDFPLHAFYAKSGISGLYPPPYFQFDRYCESRTTWTPGTFWGPNRRVFYQILAYELFVR